MNFLPFRPECTRYTDGKPKRDLHLADRSLTSIQGGNYLSHDDQWDAVKHITPNFGMGINSNQEIEGS